MSEPSRADAIRALSDRDSAVVVLVSYGAARTARTPADVDAAISDPEATLMVVSGNWAAYRHLLSPEHRHVEARERSGHESPEREPDGEPDPWPPRDDADGEGDG